MSLREMEVGLKQAKGGYKGPYEGHFGFHGVIGKSFREGERS